MNKFLTLTIFLLLAGVMSCGVIRETPKYAFADGYYFSKIFHQKNSRVYVDNSDDSIYIYPVIRKDKIRKVDTSVSVRLSFPQLHSEGVITSHNFRETSFDIDFLTIPFKFRPSIQSFPRQFNANLNGAVYIGYRNDIYRLWYKKTPIHGYQRQTTHYGFSVGFFTGLGGTTMNPWVTNNQIVSEYDGVVWSKGIAAIVGVDKFTLGLAVGWDNLLDKNRNYWIYQGNHWIGLAFGLNLN